MAEAEQLLQEEMAQTAEFVDAGLFEYANPAQRGALYSFTYNEGMTAERSSTALRLFNDGDAQGCADALLAWDKLRDPTTNQLVYSRGLDRRRQFERAVFLGKVLP